MEYYIPTFAVTTMKAMQLAGKIVFFFSLFLCCSSSLVHAQCSANAGSDVTICNGSSTILAGSGTVPSGTKSYSWGAAQAGLSCYNCSNPIASPTVTTTYVLTVSNSSGCTTTDNVTVTVNPKPIANFTFTTDGQCANIPFTFTNTSTGGVSYQWDFGDPGSGSDNASALQNPTHTFNSIGSGTVSYNVKLIVTGSNGCTNSFTQVVNVRSTPDPSLEDPITNMKNCGGTNFNLKVYNTTGTDPNNNYRIIWGDGSPDFNDPAYPGGGVSHTYVTSEIFDLLFIVTGTNGCTDTVIYNIANITNPAIGAANPGGTTGCGPLSLCFPLNNFSSNHPTTYYIVDYGDYSPPDTLPHPPPATVCHTYDTASCGIPGNAFIFKIKAINLCDKSEATIAPIRIFTGPKPIFTPTPNPGCAGTPVKFINTSKAGFNSSCNSSTIFDWDFGDGQTLTTVTKTSPNHTYAAPGTYTVTLGVSNTCGSYSTSQTVCIEQPPVPDFSITPTSGCVPFVASVTDLSTKANTCSVDYNWSVIFDGSTCLPSSGTYLFTGGTSATSLNPSIQFLEPGTYRVVLTLTNSCGAFTSEKTVTAQGPPQITLNPLAAICAGTSTTPTAVVNDCYKSITSYAWTFPGGSPAAFGAATPPAITYNTDGTFTVSLTVKNACGTQTQTTPIVVNPHPGSLHPAVNTPVCSGQTANFTSDNLPGVTYNWSGPAGTTSSLQNFSITNVSAANAGTYTLFGSFGTCSGPSGTVNLVVTPAPVVTVTPVNPTICANGSVALKAAGAGSYTWSPTTNLTPSSGANVTANPLTTTTYTVTGTTGTCTGTATTTVNVNPLPTVNAGSDTSLCNQPIPVQLTGTPAGGTWTGTNVTSSGVFTPGSTGSSTLTYSFTDGNGCSASDTRIVTVVAPSTAATEADFSLCADAPNRVVTANPVGGTWTGTGVTAAGTFDPTTAGLVKLVYTFGAGSCLTQDTLKITVNPLPVVNAGTDFAKCIDAGLVTLSGTPAGGTWTGTGITNPTGKFSPPAAGAGSFTLTYNVTIAATGCSNSDLLIATVYALPVVDAGPDTTLCSQPIPVQLGSSPSGGTWSGTNVTPGGSFTPSGNGTFVLTYSVTDSHSCFNKDQRTVTVGSAVIADAGSDFAVCIDAPDVTLTATPAGGTWTGTDVSPGGIFNPATAGIVKAVYTFGSGTCLTRDTVQILVNPLPVVNAGSNFTKCIDAAPFVLSGTPAGGTWTGTGITNPAGNFSPAAAGTGNHTLTYQFTDPSTGCTNTDVVVAKILPLPVVNAGNDTTVCNQPIPVQLSGTPASGTWSGPGVTSAGVFTPSGPGSFVLTYSFSNASGCTSQDQLTVSVVNPVPANAGADKEVCIDAPNFTLTGTPAGGAWTGTGVSPGGVFDPTVAGTVKLVYTFGSGNCLTHDTMLVIVDALPIVSIGPDADFCPSDAPFDFTESPAGGTWSGTGITNTANGTFDPGTPAVGSYVEIYTYTNPATGCVNRDTLTAIIHPTPAVGLSFKPITCVGVNEQFTNSSTAGSTYTWNFDDGSTSGTKNPKHTYLSAGFFDVKLVVVSPFGCSDSLTKTIEVRVPPTADFSLAPDSSCAPVIASFTNNSTGPLLTYNWDFGNGQSSTAANPGTITYTQGFIGDTTYTVTLLATNFCGTDTHTETITVLPKPTAVFGTGTNTGCSPLALDIANTSRGLPDTYSWDFGNGDVSTTSAAFFQHTFIAGNNDTTYTIRLAVKNECGVDTAYHSITVSPNKVHAFFNIDNPSGCVPHTVHFTQFSVGATFYSWNFDDGNVSGTQNPVHTFTTAGTFTVALYVNDGCGYDTVTTTITVFPSPFVDFSFQPDSVCINEPFDFTNLSVGLANSVWAFGDGDSSDLFNPSHAYAGSGTFPVTLTGTSLTNGCVASITHPVIVSVNPVAAFTPTPTSGCAPLTVKFTNNSTNSTFRSWKFGDNNSSTLVSPTHTYTAAGSFTVKLYVENANGCADSIEQVITVHPLPVADFTMTTTNTCYPPVTINLANTSTGAINYEWDFDDGTSSTLTSPGHVYPNPGDYFIKLVATNIYGCADSITKQLTVYPTPVAAFVLPQDSVCEGTPVVFSSTSNFADSVSWNFGNGTFYTGDSVSHVFETPGTFQVTMIAYGEGGCSDTLTLNAPITVTPTPKAGFTFLNIQNPDPLSGTVEFTNTSKGASSYLWEFGNGDSSLQVNPTERYHSFGDFLATLYVYNHFGCSDTVRQYVSVDFFYGLYIPNAISPGHSNFEVANFVPKGVGLKEFELLIFDDWGNLIWQTSAVDSEGRPTEYWDGTFNGVPVQEDSYVWKATATFLNEEAWEGKKYPKKFKRSGSITVIR